MIISIIIRTNTDYNNNYAHTTHKYLLQFRSDGEKALLKVDSESLCLRSNGSSFHVAGL